ncbi:MAG: ATPase domain-containing protein [Candidatus Micrarchaeota archaeon]|nr:ATPase domain-containing protein [Candidatus Micrarchaeota archaeon]
MMAREFIKSGIPGLDALLSEGFLKGSVIALSGPTGCGKSTLAMQFLVNGTLKSKEPGLYISVEQSKQSMYFNLSGYSWDMEKMEKGKQIVFLDYPMYEIDQFLNANSAIQEIINSTGVKRVVIDSIMPVALHFKDEDERKKGLLKLIDNIRKWGTTTLVLSEDTPATTQDVLPDTKYGVESFTDGWIQIYYLFSPKDKERTRAIEVLKMKGVHHSAKIVPCEITDEGFIVYSK